MSCHVKSDCAVQHQHSHVPLSPFKRLLPLVVSSLVALFITTSCGCIDPTFTRPHHIMALHIRTRIM